MECAQFFLSIYDDPLTGGDRCDIAAESLIDGDSFIGRLLFELIDCRFVAS